MPWRCWRWDWLFLHSHVTVLVTDVPPVQTGGWKSIHSSDRYPGGRVSRKDSPPTPWVFGEHISGVLWQSEHCAGSPDSPSGSCVTFLPVFSAWVSSSPR